MAGIGSINFGGLVSGLDTNKIIDDLMGVESRPLKRLENRKTDLNKKFDTFTSMKSSLIDLKTKVSELKSSTSFEIFSASSSDEEALTLSASTSANEGTYSVKILSLAQAETLSSNSFEESNEKLGLKGEILVNGKSFRIRNSYNLSDIRNGINALDAGVTASILKVSDGDNRLIVSSDTQGKEGFFIANVGSSDILGELGITDGTKRVRKISNGNVLSTEFESSTATIGSLFGLSSSVSGSVSIRGESLKINLSKDTLSSIRDKINELEIAGVNAAIESVTEDDTTTYRLAITGTEDFIDDKNIFETLGILEGGTSGSMVVTGSDSRILVNNIEVTRNSNTINDVLTGLNLTLKKADPDTEIVLTVERNDEEIKSKIEDFVKTYNEFIGFVDENSQFDEENNTAGPLLGDQTARSVLSRIRNALRSTVFDGDFRYNQLVQIGIETTAKGKLELDVSKLNDAMDEDMESVVSLFAATRQSSDNDISFIYHSNRTKSGTYDVAITRAAEQAAVVSELAEGEIKDSGSLSITDNYGNTLEVDYSADMTLEDIGNAIVTEAQKTYGEILRSSAVLFQLGSEGQPVTQNTAISDITGVKVEDGDTITINGTDRRGREYQRILTPGDDESTTIQDIMDALENIADNEVNATIDAEGRLQIEDTQTGQNQFSFSIETTIKGLDFGEFISAQEGRNRVTLEASVTEDNRLRINHTSYGSENTITISGGASLGIADGEYAGVDVVGTINGVVSVGKGQSLTASNDDENSRGIVLRTEITPEELGEEGSAQGSVTLISGIADLIYNELNMLTDPVGGFIQAKIDSVELSIDSLNIRINSAQNRLDQRRGMLVRKFTEMERALARLDAMRQRLTASLSALPTTSLLQ